MEAGEGRISRWLIVWPWWVLLLGLVSGCAVSRMRLDQALVLDPALHSKAIDSYLAACPDVLDISVAGCAELGGLRKIDPDGCIKLEGYGRIRVEGKNVATIAREMAEFCEVPRESVQVQVAEHRSQQLYLTGQVSGLPRAVPYQGSETVLELLQRVGGITPGAAVDDVYVVRCQVAEGQQPQVFRVDLRGILVQHDLSTNVPLQPFDHIFVGETRQCCLEKCLPPWLRPVYELVCGMKR